MSGSVTVFYGAVVTPVDSRTWKALPMCLMGVGSTGNIDWMLDYVEEDKLEETLSRKDLVASQVVYLKDGELIVPGFIDTHTVCVYTWNSMPGSLLIATTPACLSIS